MPISSIRTGAVALACAAVLGAGSARAATVDHRLDGRIDDGPLAGQTFSGSFAYDAGLVGPDPNGEVPLTAVRLQLAGRVYTLAGADAPPTAWLVDGTAQGLNYIDVNGVDTAQSPGVSFYTVFGEGVMAYELAGAGGFGSYTISAVPEPGSWALLLGGLAALGARARRRQAAQPTV